MFKCHIGITSLPINTIFTVYNAHHTYYTRKLIVCTLKLEKMKKFINCLLFMEYIYGIICPNKILSMYHMNVTKTIKKVYTM